MINSDAQKIQTKTDSFLVFVGGIYYSVAVMADVVHVSVVHCPLSVVCRLLSVVCQVLSVPGQSLQTDIGML